MVTRAQLLASLLRGPEKIYIIAISSLKLRGLRDFPICGRLLVFAGVLRVFAGVLRVILVVFFLILQVLVMGHHGRARKC